MQRPKDIVAAIRASVPAAENFEFEVVEITEAGVRIRLPVSPAMLRLGDTVSGPTLMMLVDTAIYAALIAHVEHGRYGVTSHLNIEFLRRPDAAPLLAEACLLRVGRRQVTASVAIHSEGAEALVAYATGGYALFKPS